MTNARNYFVLYIGLKIHDTQKLRLVGTAFPEVYSKKIFLAVKESEIVGNLYTLRY